LAAFCRVKHPSKCFILDGDTFDVLYKASHVDSLCFCVVCICMKKADLAEHPKVFRQVGLLFNEPSGRTSLLFNQSSGEFEAHHGKLSCFNQAL
jgi:hypothetical protein